MKFIISIEAEVILVNLLLLLPAAGFWVAVIMRLAFGTDYFFDVVFENTAKTIWGNIVLAALVIFLPGLGVGINGMMYRHKNEKLAMWMAVMCGLFLAAGFFAAVKRA